MPALHIRDVPLDVVEALKRRAARQERSLQGELRHLLAEIAREEPAAEPRPPLNLHTVDGVRGAWSREEIYGDDGR